MTGRIPGSNNVDEIQAAFRDVWARLGVLVPFQMQGQQVAGAAEASKPDGLVTLSQLQREINKILDLLGELPGDLDQPEFAVSEVYMISDDPNNGDWQWTAVGNPGNVNRDDDDTNVDITTTPGTIIVQRAGRYLVSANLTWQSDINGASQHANKLYVNFDGSGEVQIWDEYTQVQSGANRMATFCDVLDLEDGATLRFNIDLSFDGGNANKLGGYMASRVLIMEIPQ